MSGKKVRFQIPLKLFRTNSSLIVQIGNEFQTVRLAVEKAQVPKVLRRTLGTASW